MQFVFFLTNLFCALCTTTNEKWRGPRCYDGSGPPVCPFSSHSFRAGEKSRALQARRLIRLHASGVLGDGATHGAKILARDRHAYCLPKKTRMYLVADKPGRARMRPRFCRLCVISEKGRGKIYSLDHFFCLCGASATKRIAGATAANNATRAKKKRQQKKDKKIKCKSRKRFVGHDGKRRFH